MEGGITGDPAFRGDALVIEQHIPAFVEVEEKVQFAAGVDQFVGNEVFGLVIELAFGNDIAPLQVALLIIRQHHQVLRVIAGGIAAAGFLPQGPCSRIVIRVIITIPVTPVGISYIPAVVHCAAGGGIQRFADQQVAAVTFGDNMFDKKSLKAVLMVASLLLARARSSSVKTVTFSCRRALVALSHTTV
jgi:hypothetical protein